MQTTHKIMSRDVIVEFVDKGVQQLLKILYEYAGWVFAVMFTVGSKVFYEAIRQGKFKMWLMLMTAGLGFCVGMVGIIVCAILGLTGKFIFWVILASLCAYKIVQYFSNYDEQFIIMIGDKFKEVIDIFVKKK